jgi:uncharacterized membrane protein
LILIKVGDRVRPMSEPNERAECLICHRRLKRSELRPLASVSDGVAARLRADLGALPEDGFVCREDLARYRRLYVERLLEAERGELGALDREVLASLEAGETVAEDTTAIFAERRTFGERSADSVAAFGGSWTFILLFCGVLVAWMGLNMAGVLVGTFDPYPFILLNLVLSCMAALQAPVIMMSQRRQEAMDRLRAENDYKVNLKAELEIRHLHEKIDQQLTRHWQRLAEIQRVQIEMLEEIAASGGGGSRPG